jgi:hypothetical protein
VTDRLIEVLNETTVELRKGDSVEERQVGGVAVTDIYMMPHVAQAGPDLELVDVVFETIGVDKAKAPTFREELIGLLDKLQADGLDLAGGPSYISTGGVIGSQSYAFRLYALGQVLGFWRVITPENLGIKGEEARSLAGSGFVYISGYKPEGV